MKNMHSGERLLGLVDSIRSRVHWKRPLTAILLIALIHGILYIFIIPPFWHYDEPGHFEYAWLVANRPDWPAAGEYDEGMRRELAGELQRNGWYELRGLFVDPSADPEIWIGQPQTGDQPAYYWLASLPLRLFQNSGLAIQVYAARFVSLLLFLFTIFAAGQIAAELFSEHHPLAWMVPFFLALLPGLVDTMTSVNNDAGAVAAYTLFVWTGVLALRRGFNPGRVIMVALSTLLCYETKSSAWPALLLAPLAVLLAALTVRASKVALRLLALGGVLLLPLMFGWGDPAGWFNTTSQPAPARKAVSSAPLGEFAFALEAPIARNDQHLGQFLAPDLVRTLRGKAITFGTWIWASNPIEAGLPVIQFTNGEQITQGPAEFVELSATPAFHSASMVVPPDAFRGWVLLDSLTQAPPGTEIFMDGLVLTDGQFKSDTEPDFADASARSGSWDGRLFQNILRNGSAEASWIRIRPQVYTLSNRIPFVRNQVSIIVVSILDARSSAWYYRQTSSSLFRTFWASMAAEKVFLRGDLVYSLLKLITIAAVAGALFRGYRTKPRIEWRVALFIIAACLLVWGSTVIRGSVELLRAAPLTPWARYAYPAVVPTAIILCYGWLEILSWMKILAKTSDEVPNLAFIGFMGGLGLYGLLTILHAFDASVRPFFEEAGYLLILLMLQLTIGSLLLALNRQLQAGPRPEK